MRVLKFSRARYYRESGIMNARKKTEKWNAEVQEHLVAISQVTKRGANFRAFLEFMKILAADDEAHWKAYPKAQVSPSAFESVQREAAYIRHLFNELSALKEHESQRLVVAN